MNEVKKFDHELFGQLSVIMYEDKPHFIANEVVNILGYKNKSETLQYHCKSVIKLDYSKMLELKMEAKPTGIQIIPESDVYRLIMRSNLPNAEQFQDWVMEEVLPSLRKTGGFVSDVDQIIETFYKNEAPHIKEVIRAGLNFQKNNQHKIDFADDVADVVNLRSMNEVAKAFGVGRNKMFAKMRDLGILDIKNAPYQTYIDRGYFKVNQVTKHSFLHNVTMVTGKGEVWLHKKLKEESFLLAA
jgi:prophage antirepressor-like protein